MEAPKQVQDVANSKKVNSTAQGNSDSIDVAEVAVDAIGVIAEVLGSAAETAGSVAEGCVEVAGEIISACTDI